MTHPTIANTDVPRAILGQHVAVLGKTRSGKSSVMRLLVEDLLARQEPVCIVDPKGDWWGLKLARDGRSAGFPVVIFGGDHADIPITEHAGMQIAELFATDNRPCLIDLGGWTVGQRTRLWIEFASTLFRHTKGQRWLVVDEVHNFCPKGKVFDADAGKALHWTNRLASEGLGKGLSMVFASQRPQKVHNDTLTSAETLIAMRVLHPSDRGAVADWIKGCGDADGSTVLGSLAQMARGEGWVWSPEIRYGPSLVRFPMFKTYDSFRPQTVEESKRLKGWAAVDLEAVRVKMAEALEQAKSTDPRELQKEIAALKAKLSAAGTVAAQPAKPVLTEADRAKLEKLTEFIRALQVSLRDVEIESLRDIRSMFEERWAQWATDVESRRKGFEHALSRLSPGLTVAVGQIASPQARAQQAVRSSAPRRPVAPTNGHSGTLPPGEAAVLRAVLTYPGLERHRLSVLTGYKRSSRDAYLARLGGKGLIEINANAVEPTESALSALPDFEPLPTGQALVDHWRERLPDGERAVLDVLLSTRGAVERSAIDERTGYKRSSRDAYLARLKARGLVDYCDRGRVAASPDLRG